jgi:PAS domain-containing protein
MCAGRSRREADVAGGVVALDFGGWSAGSWCGDAYHGVWRRLDFGSAAVAGEGSGVTSADGARVGDSAESSMYGVFVVALDGVIRSWHPASERLYGYSAEQTQGRSIELLDVPGDGHFREHLNARGVGVDIAF